MPRSRTFSQSFIIGRLSQVVEISSRTSFLNSNCNSFDNEIPIIMCIPSFTMLSFLTGFRLGFSNINIGNCCEFIINIFLSLSKYKAITSSIIFLSCSRLVCSGPYLKSKSTKIGPFLICFSVKNSCFLLTKISS